MTKLFKIGTLTIFLPLLAACTSTLKETQPMLIAKVETPILTSTPTYQPTEHHIQIPIVFGTPLTDYNTIPIPNNATAGMEENGEYIFTSKQSPSDIMIYYQKILPQSSWEIQDTQNLEVVGDDKTYTCMTISQTDGLLHALICASSEENDKLTYIRIDVYITD